MANRLRSEWPEGRQNATLTGHCSIIDYMMFEQQSLVLWEILHGGNERHDQSHSSLPCCIGNRAYPWYGD